jgi:hypothetical protein
MKDYDDFERDVLIQLAQMDTTVRRRLGFSVLCAAILDTPNPRAAFHEDMERIDRAVRAIENMNDAGTEAGKYRR